MREGAEAGIETATLQAHLARGQRAGGGHRLYIVDESSLASTRQMHDFVARLHPNDRVLLVAAHRTRDSKELQSLAEVLHRHRELAAEHGHQVDWVVTRALANHRRQEVDAPKMAK